MLHWNSCGRKSKGCKQIGKFPFYGMSEPNVPSIDAAPFVNAETLQPSASGQNRAIGQTEHHLLKVDDVEETVLDYQSTVKTGYYNHADYRLTLSKGVHTLTFTHDGENQSSINANLRVTASLDKMDLTYVTGQENTVIVEAEENIRNNPYTLDRSMKGFSGDGKEFICEKYGKENSCSEV